MANKTRSKTAENASAVYKTSRKWETNRKRKLEKQLKLQPNNLQVANALKNMVYRRKTPKTKMWSASWVAIAKVYKMFEGRFDPKLMSSNAKVAMEANMVQSKVSSELLRQKNHPKQPHQSTFFSLGARLQGVK